MNPETIDFVKWAIGGAATAVGGSGAVIAGIRKGGVLLQRHLDSKKEVATIRADNEVFKSEVRQGLADIKHVKTVIQRLDAHLRAQANLDPRPIFFVCDKGDVTFVNREFTRLLGWTTDDMRDSGIVNAFHADDQRRVATEWEHAVKDHRMFMTRARLQHASGRQLPFDYARVEALVMRCTDGTVYGWQGILHLDGRRADD